MLLQFSFFTNALIIALLLSIIFSLLSFFIVTKKLSFLAVGTEHAAFGGVGLAHILGWNQLITTMIFCTLITIFAGHTHKKSSELGISLLFAIAMAFGLILLAFVPNNAFNLQAFLFGDLLAISKSEIISTFIFISIVLIILLPNLHKILFIIFDKDIAYVAGINVTFWNTILYAILSMSIVFGIKLVGVLLVTAMTLLPAMFALLWKKNILISLGIAFIFTLISMVSGITLSFYWDIVPGALIVMIGSSVYFFMKWITKTRSL